MFANPRPQFGQDVQAAIEDTIAQYEFVLSSNFEKQEQKLIQELFEQAKQKKKDLAIFKKNLSQDNIDRLISERRREKEKERQGLESRWRECNESYKTLQEQQKRLINQHKENLFDAKKLQEKIAQLQSAQTRLKEKVQNMQQKQVKFMTETHQGYQSPYKRQKTVDFKEAICSQKMRKLDESHTVFFSNKYSLSKQVLSTQLKKQDTLNHISKTHKYQKPKIKTLNVKSPKLHLRKLAEKENKKQQLFKFFLNPKIKEKIFEILNREL